MSTPFITLERFLVPPDGRYPERHSNASAVRLRPRAVTYGHRKGVVPASYAVTKGRTNAEPKLEVLQGTLDQTLDSMGPQHGYGIARRIEQVSDDILNSTKALSTPP